MSDDQSVLFVEDDDLIREIKAIELEDAGYGVVVVESGDVAGKDVYGVLRDAIVETGKMALARVVIAHYELVSPDDLIVRVSAEYKGRLQQEGPVNLVRPGRFQPQAAEIIRQARR